MISVFVGWWSSSPVICSSPGPTQNRASSGWRPFGSGLDNIAFAGLDGEEKEVAPWHLQSPKARDQRPPIWTNGDDV